MLSIDEAIAKYKEITNVGANCPAHCNISCDKCVQESKQLVEWLEELKDLREMRDAIESNANTLEQNGYNKAIDDLRNELKNHYTEYNIDCVLEDNDFYSYTTACNYLEDYIDEIAEQLKEGGKNE